MIRPTLATVLLLAVLTVPAGAQAPRKGPGPERELHPLLRRVDDSRSAVRMVGVRTVQVGFGPNSRVTTERYFRSGARFRIETVGEGQNRGQIVVEDGRRRLVYFPAKNEIREQPPLEGRLLHALRRASAGPPGRGGKPKFVESDGGTIAGHKTRLLEVQRPDGQASMRLWIQPEQAVVLKLQSLSPRGEQLAYFEFTRVAFGQEIPESQFRLDMPGARFVSPQDELERVARQANVRPLRLPEDTGYRLEAVRRVGSKGREILVQTYAGPRGRLSLFVLRGEIDERLLARIASGREDSHVWQSGPFTLVLIGDLPPEQLRRLAGRVGA